MIFKTSRDLRAALVAALEKAMNGTLDPVAGRRLISAAKIFDAEHDRKISMLRGVLYAKGTQK
jgi:hypothetical protein